MNYLKMAVWAIIFGIMVGFVQQAFIDGVLFETVIAVALLVFTTYKLGRSILRVS